MDYFLICAIGSLITGFILGMAAGIAVAGKDNKRLEDMVIDLEADLKWTEDHLYKTSREVLTMIDRRDRAKMARILRGEE